MDGIFSLPCFSLDTFAIRTFIQFTALFLTLEAAYFLAKGNLTLSPPAIAHLARTKFGANQQVVRSLSKQRAETWVGVVLLLMGFVLQFLNALWPIRIGDFAVNTTGVLFSLVFSGAICGVSWSIAKRCTRKTENEVWNIIREGRDIKEMLEKEE